MFQWYLLIAWVSCSSFPAGLRVLTFHVPTAMFSLPLIFLIFGTPVAYLSPTSRCLTVGTVIVILGCDRSGIKLFLVFIIMVYLGQSSAWRSPSLSRLFILTTAEIHDYCMARLGHEHMAVDSRVLPPWPLTSSRKTSAQWCCVITTPNWPIGLGDSWRRERLISSQQVIDLSTAYNINNQTQGAKVIGPYPYLQWPL